MEIVRGLFGDWGLVRNWGRIGRSGTLRTDWFNTETEAKDARFDLHMKKAKRGYE
jgi:predicted DNA-binding WGR domain protein